VSDVDAAAVRAAYPKTVVLRDGAHLVLRLWSPGEPDPLPALRTALPAVEQAPSEDGERFTVVAVDGEAVVAVATLRPSPGAGDEAALEVMLHPAYRRRRLGTWLLLDVVHLAAELGIEQVCARARADDEAYVAALRRLDFGLDANARVPAGSVVLRKHIHTEWTDF
jgi:GNAT superfamily N-acetyltransferase